MKQHLTQEEWIDFIYRELDSTRRREIERHLEHCPACQQRQLEFGATTRALDEWTVTIPRRYAFARSWMPAMKWAAAAVLLLSTAFAAGRFSSADIDKVSAELNASFQTRIDEMRAETDKAVTAALAANQRQLQQLAAQVAQVREEDRQAIYTSLQEMETRQLLELRKLRQNLETVAVNADQSLKDAQRKLVRLASYTAPQQP